MNAKAKFKQKRHFFSLIIIISAISYIVPVRAQIVRDHRTQKKDANVRDHRTMKEDDPFTRLKKEAQKAVVEKTIMEPVEISANNPNWKGISKPEIKFVPFELEDSYGNAITPDRIVTLENGKIMTAQELLDKMNELEKKLNARGYSLRDSDEKIVSTTATDEKFLDGRRSTVPKSIAPFKKEAEVQKFMSLEKIVKVAGPSAPGRPRTITLKPYSSYTKSERDNINKYDFSNISGAILATTKRGSFKDLRTKKLGNPSQIFEVNETNKAPWNFGNPDKFQASIEGAIERFAKIFPFDPENMDHNKSEFGVKATGRATGSLLGKSIDVLNASCQFYAPSDISKKMTASISVKAMEYTFINKNEEYSQQQSFSKIHGKPFEVSFALTIPLIPGIDFNGFIGARGEIGFEYEARIERTVASVHAKPIVDLKVYGEGGLSFLGAARGGVEAELTFIKGELDLNAHTGIFSQNIDEIVVGVNYYFGYDIEILSGSISAFGKACIPYTDRCYRKDYELFEWKGFKNAGTIVEGDYIPITLANIPQYDEEPVFIKD